MDHEYPKVRVIDLHEDSFGRGPMLRRGNPTQKLLTVVNSGTIQKYDSVVSATSEKQNLNIPGHRRNS
jgi:hypothetical protein